MATRDAVILQMALLTALALIIWSFLPDRFKRWIMPPALAVWAGLLLISVVNVLWKEI
jgi:uncharacterized membrane protein YqjE